MKPFEPWQHIGGYEHVFDVEHLRFCHRSDCLSKMNVLEMRMKFASGRQARIVEKSSSSKLVVAVVPASTWDALKHSFVQWIPDLNFGWLTPVMREITAVVEIQKQEEWVNIYPLPTDYPQTDIRFPELLPIDFLLADPPSLDDVRNADRQRREAEHVAQYFLRERL